MKIQEHIKDLYNEKNDKVYVIENGLTVRDVLIEVGIDTEVYIGHVSDLHFNYCNQQDFAEANPVVMSTYENRVWLANGESVPNIRRCMEFIADADQMIVNGDTMDYLSYGCMELMQREVWDKYPGVLAIAGGHELRRNMQSLVDDETDKESRIAIVAEFWKHNIYYETRLIKDKVLVIGLLNDEGRYNAYQEERLKEDLALSREKDYTVLIFQHEPICTNNPIHISYGIENHVTQGDIHGGKSSNFCNGGGYAGAVSSDEQTMRVYKLITGSADVVKGVFAGHFHNDLYLEILGSTPEGEKKIIPQYVNTASAYDDGHVMRILIK